MSKLTSYQYGLLCIGAVVVAMILIANGRFSEKDSRVTDKDPGHSFTTKATVVERVSSDDSMHSELDELAEPESAAQDTNNLLHPRIKVLYDEGKLLDSVKTELSGPENSGQRYVRETELYRTNNRHFPLVLRVKILQQNADDIFRPVADHSVMGGHFLIRINEGIDFDEFNAYAIAQNTALDQFGLPEGMYKVVIDDQHSASALLDAIERFNQSGYVQYAEADEINVL